MDDRSELSTEAGARLTGSVHRANRPDTRWSERLLHRALVMVALVGLLSGLAASYGFARDDAAGTIWTAATLPILAALAYSMWRDVSAGRMGVDAVAFVSISAALALGEPLAGIVVAIMYSSGNVLEDFAVGRAERDLKTLVDRAPRIAHRRLGTTVEDVPVDGVIVGDVLLVRGGEVIPVDGAMLAHGGDAASIDESALTGEPFPAARRVGDMIASGTVNVGDAFDMRASATAGESTYAGIVRLVTAAQTAKAPFIRIADRYALLLLPVSLFVAGLAWLYSGDEIRALAVLVVATPCPLILAAPVAFISGVSQAARRGVLIKGGAALEALASIHTVMFDKTGTLTVGGARLLAIEVASGESADRVLSLAASLEQASHHVIATAIVGAARARKLSIPVAREVRETFGSGLEGLIDGHFVRVGSHHLVFGARAPGDWATRALRRAAWRSALSVFVSVDGRDVGALLLGDELRRETPRAVHALRKVGVRRIVMLTGDRIDAAETIASALDVDAVLADRVPADKVDAVVVEQRQHPTLMVGDGINDAPALAAADVGIAMGARGASASSEAADVVILVDRLDRVSDAVVIAKRARRIAVQSIVAGMALSGIAMIAAALGWLTPVAGALTQEVIDVAVILNALRALTPRRGRSSGRTIPAGTVRSLTEEHIRLETGLDRLRAIADALDDAEAAAAVSLINEANSIVARDIVEHERQDEVVVYPRVVKFLADDHALGAMSRAHREIIHLARLLARMADGLVPAEADRYLVRDAQRAIEALEALVRLHNAQEQDIYDHAAGAA